MKKLIFLFLFFLCSEWLLAQPQTLTLKPDSTSGKDAMVASCIPCGHTNRNFGKRPIMDINGWTFSGNTSRMRGLIAFDYSSIPANAVILEAKLNLYYSGLPQNQNGPHSPLSSANSVRIRRITSPWVDTLVTWNNQPTFVNTGEVTIPHPTSGTQSFLDIDITNLVVFQHANPAQNHGFVLMQNNEIPFYQITVASSNHPNPNLHPMLEVTYEFPCPVMVAADFNFSVGANRQVTFTNTSTITPGVTNYRWTFGDGGLSLSQNPVYSYNADGNFTVCLAVTDTCSTDTICKTVSICGAPNLSFAINQLGPQTFQFASNWPNASSYLWDFGDGNLSVNPNPTYTYPTSGTYNVCLTATDSICGTQTICRVLDPCSASQLSFTANQVGQRTIRFTPSITSATSYNWDLGDGRISVVQSPLITYAQEGTYYVCLTTQDSCGTRSTCDSVVATNTIGLSDFQVSGFNVYPNPAQGLLYLDNPEQKVFTYQLLNTVGQLILPPTPSQQEQTALEVGHLPRGVYLLQIQINESSYFQRLILN